MVRVFLAYQSELVGTRLVEMLLDTGNVDVTGAVFNSGTLVKELDRCRPDIAILDMRLLLGAQVHDLTALKLRHPSVHFVLMYDYPFTRFSRECLRFGAEYCFDTLHEFTHLGAFIAEVNTSRRCEAASCAG